MREKHGLSQYRLNHAKSYAQNFLELVNKVELMFQMSQEGLVTEEAAEQFIKRNIDSLDRDWEYFKSYIAQLKD